MRQRQGYGRFKAAWSTYRNHCLFGQVVIDRFAMWAGKRFQVEVEGSDHFNNLVGKKEGFIQMSAHIGNYELAGYTLCSDRKQFNALVYGGEKPSVVANRQKMFAANNINMIAVSPDMRHLFEINSALATGQIVSLPADRLLGSDKSIEADFLGAKALFPYGPFSIATMRSLEVIAVNVVKTGTKKYKIIIIPLRYDTGAPRREQVIQLNTAFVSELERVVKMYPTQWYNFYEFWK